MPGSSDAEESVAAGACVQAAAVRQGESPDAVAAAWGLGAGTAVEPRPVVDAAGIRAAYAAAGSTAAGLG